jgi:hypothetical protein
MYGKPNVTQQVAVTTATPVTISTGTDSIPLVYPMVVTAVPGATGTLLVEYQVAVEGVWQEWPAGTVSTTTTYLLTGPVYALKFTASTDDGIVEIAQ